MTIARNRKLVLIGNGFDLAHGLPTRYDDFIRWYLLQEIKGPPFSLIKDKHLITLEDGGAKFWPDEIEDYLDHILKTKTNQSLQSRRFSFENSFLKSIWDSFTDDKRWVDIEMDYYNLLKRCRGSDGRWNKNLAAELQADFTQVKELFSLYIKEIVTYDTNKVPLIFTSYFEKLDEKDAILNFNYTNVVSIYKTFNQANYDIYDIHGNLSKRDDVVFGFGDERDEFYEYLENLNDNSFLTHAKSFHYFKDDTYSKLERFIDNPRPFDVEIIGLSCGITDRTLLSYIFEHNSCEKIQIHYYKDFTNYLNVCMEISRHFKDKLSMRNKIRDFSACTACPQA
ncbi:AbiH family protein [Fulvivirga ligni]|uniref:AbiH family protein n=1 Tax=Fulvivirga ligni TaxID=2904246 RepID=UPI001F2097C6|nr:AbiH family protein [Fulvivirga ligni]UII21194.1 bacteriophage abortive infection AbiH family protein [Fulvivirga ligni]